MEAARLEAIRIEGEFKIIFSEAYKHKEEA
jgi:hypothetical protein